MPDARGIIVIRDEDFCEHDKDICALVAVVDDDLALSLNQEMDILVDKDEFLQALKSIDDGAEQVEMRIRKTKAAA